MIIRRGARGERIRDIQKRLNELGFGPVGEDAIYGRQTEKAIKAFQDSVGLVADGVFGPRTRQKFSGAENCEELPENNPLLIEALKRQGFQVFTDGRINIIGVRENTQKANSFDDRIHLLWMSNGAWQEKSYPCTCDPGNYWLEHGRIDGTAILCAGQYVDVYKFDLHGGKYETLCQRGGPVKVWRDQNRDNTLDHSGNPDEGWHGINIHHAGTDSQNVDKWSAGCQVFARLADWKEAMKICKDSGKEWFTYTLIEESDI